MIIYVPINNDLHFFAPERAFKDHKKALAHAEREVEAANCVPYYTCVFDFIKKRLPEPDTILSRDEAIQALSKGISVIVWGKNDSGYNKPFVLLKTIMEE